jgi:cell division septum initiation protein DivIVA
VLYFHEQYFYYREEERLNNLRERYEAFLEEERQRRERNERILQALDRIESRTAMLTAKSERLRLLRVSNLQIHRFCICRQEVSVYY